jgi:ERF superfamily
VSTAIETIEPSTALAPSIGASMLEVIARAASDPTVDVDKMQRLLDMQMQMMAKQAEIEFNEALARLQAKLPKVDRKGRIEYVDKNKETRSTPFARYEDIDDVVRPLMAEEGFTISFTSVCEDRITVVGQLAHKHGHSKTAEMRLPIDSSGAKNPTQAVGSTVSYGKRYVICMLLNIVTQEQGEISVDVKTTVSPEQAREIDLRIAESGADRVRFLKLMSADSTEQIREVHYGRALRLLAEKRKRVAGGAK